MCNISSTNPQERCNLEHYTYNLRDTEAVMCNISSTNPQERCNLEHYTYNLRDTEAVICVILVLLTLKNAVILNIIHIIFVTQRLSYV